MKHVTLLIIALLLFTACTTQTDLVEKVTGTKEEIAASYIMDFTAQSIDHLLTRYNYTEKMTNALSTELFAQIYQNLEDTYGPYEETASSTRSESGDFIIISYLVSHENASLNINIVFDADNLIAGFNFTENLEEMTTETEFEEFEVTFGNEPFVLSGTLSIPAGDGPFPAVVLIHGSGSSNRDEAYLELTPFKDISYYLSDHGIAVLRFDKRSLTYGASIDPENFTPYDESIEDAGLAFDFLSTQEKIMPDHIFILGHSLGGYLMPRIASHVPEAAGYMIVAGNARRLEDIMIDQYAYIFNLDGTIDATEQATLDALSVQRQNIKSGADFSPAELIGIGRDYWQYLAQYDPMAEVQTIDKPILILQGEGDYQVTLEDFAMWEDATLSMPNVTRITYPGINHFLYQGDGVPSPQQYQSPKHVDSLLMDDLIDFIKKSTFQ